MSAEQYSLLRANVSYLGRLLGETISDADGPEFLDKIEQIRLLSKSARGGNESDGKELENVLLSLRDDELLPVTGGQKITQACRPSRHLELAECGHWVMVEHARVFNATCLDFLDNH